MSGPYKGLRSNTETGIAYVRRSSPSFAGLHLNNLLLHEAGEGATALYECTFNSGDILVAQPAPNGHPSVYRLGLNTSSGTYSETVLVHGTNDDYRNAIGHPADSSTDPLGSANYILPTGVVAGLHDPWASPEFA